VTQDNVRHYIIYSILLLLFGLRFLPFLYPDSRMFGFNHLIFIPPIYTYISLVVLIIAAIFPFVISSSRFGERTADSFSNLFIENNRKYLYLFFTVLILAALFYLFRASTHFLGDGYMTLNNLASQATTIFKWSEAGSTLLLDVVQSLFGEKNIQTAKYALQTVSITSGVITILFFILISGEISKNRTRRFLSFCCLTGSPVLLLFFGYIESYSPVWVAFSGFIYFSLRYINRDKGLLHIFLFLILSILFHLKMVIYIPAIFYLLFSSGRGLSFYKTFSRIIKIIVGFIIGLAFYLFIKQYRSDLYFENIFMTIFSGKPASPYYSMFSLAHLLDMINQLLLLSPLLPLLLYLSFGNIKNAIRTRKVMTMALMAAASLFFLLIIDPKLGMPRDWDLFSFSSFCLTLLFIILIPEIKIKNLTRFFLPITLFLIVAVLPFLRTNLNQESSTKYMKYIINLDIPKAQSSALVLRNYYYQVNDSLGAESLDYFYHDKFPNENKIEMAFSALDNNKLKLAETFLASIKPDKFSSNYHNLKSEIFFRQGKSSLALEESKKAIQLRRYDVLLYNNQALIYAAREEYELAYGALRKGHNLDSLNQNILAGMIGYHLTLGIIDSVGIYAQRLINVDTTNAYAYKMMAEMYAMQNNLTKGTEYYNLYLKYKAANSTIDSSSSDIQPGIEKIRNNKQ